LLLWLYYGAQIFLFGAELVHVSAGRMRLQNYAAKRPSHGSSQRFSAQGARR
jgi:uncharacterized BrkB/YihY/UPF0761 family membrane protein